MLSRCIATLVLTEFFGCVMGGVLSLLLLSRSSRLWSHFVVGGGLFPKADHIYRFSPPRSQHFWNAAYKMELMLNLLVPLFCVLAHQVVAS